MTLGTIAHPPGSSVQGILHARIVEWVAISFSRVSSQSRNQTWVSCITANSLLSEPPGKPNKVKRLIESYVLSWFKRIYCDWGICGSQNPLLQVCVKVETTEISFCHSYVCIMISLEPPPHHFFFLRLSQVNLSLTFKVKTINTRGILVRDVDVSWQQDNHHSFVNMLPLCAHKLP